MGYRLRLKIEKPLYLTRRQRELCRYLLTGASNKEIAGWAGITEGTVKCYLTAMFRKLKVRSRFELQGWARANPVMLRRASNPFALEFWEHSDVVVAPQGHRLMAAAGK